MGLNRQVKLMITNRCCFSWEGGLIKNNTRTQWGKWNTDLVIPVSGMFYHSGRSALRFRSSWRGCKGWKKNVLLIHIIFFVLFGERGYIFFFLLLWKRFETGVSKKPFIVDQEKTNASWQKCKKRDYFAFHWHKICLSCTISKTVQKSKFFFVKL